MVGATGSSSDSEVCPSTDHRSARRQPRGPGPFIVFKWPLEILGALIDTGHAHIQPNISFTKTVAKRWKRILHPGHLVHGKDFLSSPDSHHHDLTWRSFKRSITCKEPGFLLGLFFCRRNTATQVAVSIGEQISFKV